ncbi:MAG: peptidase [Ignavibacteria bacterium]|jgi:predicted metalloprotease with PDZ domain
MKKFRAFSFVLLILMLSSFVKSQHIVHVDLNEREDDLFYVEVFPEKLSKENGVFNFAATAPGAYQRMDLGRYVKSFQAFDKDEYEIEVEQISTNRWKIAEPEKVERIFYLIAETWDTPVEKDPIYRMAGSSIEDDNVLINGNCVFGYFDGMQHYPVNLELSYPSDWIVGTALEKNGNDYYVVEDYDHIVDSPILAGELSKASLDISGTEVDVFTYSKTGLIKSQDLLDSVEDILFAAEDFINGLPVDRYAFLFHFEDVGAGAWEHNYSSIYVMQESELTDQVIQDLRSIVAHEFFHIVTPLHIHSELVSNFNFAEPDLSQHTWFYEGVTEWASDILQLRDSLITLEEYLAQMTIKLRQAENFNHELSLRDLSENAIELQDQFYLFYCRGAAVASLLDLKLLKLSGGKRGLREVINELAKDYGTEKPFGEKSFFDEFVNRTYPEIKDFIDNYIKDAKKLPLKELYEEIGVKYIEVAGYDSSRIGFDLGIGFKDNKFVVTKVENDEYDIRLGDVYYKYNGEEITQENVQEIFIGLTSSQPGDTAKITFKRGEEEFEIEYVFKPRRIKHSFEISENATEEQLKLREVFMKNL